MLTVRVTGGDGLRSIGIVLVAEINERMVIMTREGILISEKLNEITKMCSREHPIYEQISNFSIALYVLGHFQCTDLLSADDVEEVEAGTILKQNFVRILERDVPPKYDIRKSSEKYLLVIGDPVFPTHFAVIVNMQSQRPYFSKLKFYGTGFDSLRELKSEFVGKEGINVDDIHYYRMVSPSTRNKPVCNKIYTVRSDGNYSVFEYSCEPVEKEEQPCL